MMQDCPQQQGMLDMMLMMIVTGVLAVARRSTSVSKPISAQQHLLTSGARVHLRGFRANAIEALAKTESPATTQHRSLEIEHVTMALMLYVMQGVHKAVSVMHTWIRC